MNDSYIYKFYHINSKNYRSQVLNAPGKPYEIDVEGKKYPSHTLNYNSSVRNIGTVTSSCRKYKKIPMDIEILLEVLKSSYFLELNAEKVKSLTPSAGGMYPIELYILTSENHPLNGTYHYIKTKGKLNYIRDTINYNYFLTSINQFLNDASFVVVMTAKMENLINKYGSRGYRYALIEAGHIGQNISRTVAQYQNLGCCAIGGFYDDELQRQLNLPHDEIPLYVYGIGEKEDSNDMA
ncbi:SagB/ThcOx family dehydrogenase [Rummeliibacillus sp. SL167]|uniref:SagB/ThcOx family dehydrogenase n=1 Tax=Rummeliibacillus sp. SL167 TaxID=2579792 RepID=UPI0011B512F2|nr:SagB/ThcOx family dehydrogenase [Rummeliibacillus sp. SL167]